MYNLEMTLKFKTHNRAQAEFIVKQIHKVRKLAQNLSLTVSSSMNSSIQKVKKD